MHFATTFHSDVFHFHHVFFPNSNTNYANGTEIIDIWGQVGHNFEVSVNVYNVFTNQFESFTPYVSTSSNSSLNTTIYDNDTSSSPDPCLVLINTESINTNNNKPHATVIINNSQQDDVFRYVLLEIRGNSGAVNTWLANDKNGIFSNLNIPGTTDGDTNMTVGEIGGTGNSIISVGAFTSKNTYTAFNGTTVNNGPVPSIDFPGVLGSIASFSSKGPTADGRFKPDITAPGNVIVSSVSRFDSNYTSTSVETVSGLTDSINNWYFAAMQGTSMSSPMVAGIIALWLQANPNLTVAQIKTILQNTSITDSFTGTGSAIPNNTWGRGKINAYTGIQYINQFLNVETFDTSNNFIVYPNPTSSKVYFDNSNFNFKEVAIYNYLGQEVTKTSFSNNINNQEIDMSTLATGVYVLKFSDSATSKSVKVVKQ